MGNYLLGIIFYIFVGCSNDRNNYSNLAEKKNYGEFNYSFKHEEVIDVTELMINQSISSFIISSAFKVLTIKVLNKMNSLSNENKEKHLKAIYIAVNYLDVGKTSTWKDNKKQVLGEVKVIRRFYVDKYQCVSYKEIIKKKNKKNLDYITACNIKSEWVLKNV